MGDVIDTSRWVVFYPIYINSKKTLAEGRRINASLAVENPNYVEIRDCCSYLLLPCLEEFRPVMFVRNLRTKPHKAYSRDFMQRGRVRVQLKREDGSLINLAIPTRKALMLRVAELVPKHQGRAKKQQDTSSSSGTSVTSGGKGKSGKKKK